MPDLPRMRVLDLFKSSCDSGGRARFYRANVNTKAMRQNHHQPTNTARAKQVLGIMRVFYE